mmetsp:Transcript_66610/g.182683  ORF Transcript_66610/g.182683 Transcript_66610/m.182683 type:complete len:222 (-) Transcript_66610:959-1624(-)
MGLCGMLACRMLQRRLGCVDGTHKDVLSCATGMRWTPGWMQVPPVGMICHSRNPRPDAKLALGVASAARSEKAPLPRVAPRQEPPVRKPSPPLHTEARSHRHSKSSSPPNKPVHTTHPQNLLPPRAAVRVSRAVRRPHALAPSLALMNSSSSSLDFLRPARVASATASRPLASVTVGSAPSFRSRLVMASIALNEAIRIGVRPSFSAVCSSCFLTGATRSC